MGAIEAVLVFSFDKSYLEPHFLFKMQIKTCLMTKFTKQLSFKQLKCFLKAISVLASSVPDVPDV